MRKLFSTLFIALSLVAVPIFTPSCAKENKEESEKVEVNFPLSQEDAIKLMQEMIDTCDEVYVCDLLVMPKDTIYTGRIDDNGKEMPILAPADTSWLFVANTAAGSNGMYFMLYAFVSVKDANCVITKEPILDGKTMTKYKGRNIKSVGSIPEIFPSLRKSQVRSGLDGDLRKWGVIINGGANKYSNYRRYWNDCSKIYSKLKEYSFPDDHIFVLMSTVLIPDRIEIAVRVFMTPLLWIWTEMATVTYNILLKRNILHPFLIICLRMCRQGIRFLYMFQIMEACHNPVTNHIYVFGTERLYLTTSLLTK